MRSANRIHASSIFRPPACSRLKGPKCPTLSSWQCKTQSARLRKEDSMAVANPKQQSTTLQHVGSYTRKERSGDKPPFGDSIYLQDDGTYSLSHISTSFRDEGTYKITPTSTEPEWISASRISEGDIIEFTPSNTATGHPPGKCLFLKPPGSLRLKDGRIIEPDGVEWTNLEAILADNEALTQRMNKRSSAAAAPACPGVEMMGLYKNEIFDQAMGGGVVEWIAKIRNNTSITKLVGFGWIDANGQQQRAQVQLRGGEIASPRVDMTQAKYIAPVKNLRVLSCE